MRQEQALGRVVLLPLNEDPDCDVSYSLLKFDVNDARCYDPNEEMGLRKVIAGVGLERFNNRIHALAVAFQERQSSRNRPAGAGRRLSSFSFMTGSARDKGFKSQSGLGLAVARITHQFRRLTSVEAPPAKVESMATENQNDSAVYVVESGNLDAAVTPGGGGGTGDDHKEAWSAETTSARGSGRGSAETAGAGSPALTNRISIGVINRQVTEREEKDETDRMNEVNLDV